MKVMCKLKVIFLIIACLISRLSLSQMVSNIEAIETGGSLSHYNMIGKKRPAPEISGNYYLFDNWVLADIELETNKVIAAQSVNLNAYDGEIEIPYGSEVRTLHRSKIKSFTIGDRKFLNGKYIDESTYKDTFFEVLTSGKYEVYCQYYTDLRQPTYVPGLAVGDENYKILMKKKYFFKINSILMEYESDKKQNLTFFEQHQPSLKFIRSQKLRLNKIEDFIMAVKFYNSNS